MENKRTRRLKALAAVEKAAQGSPLHRLAFAPSRYLPGMLYSKLLYPLSGRSLRRRALLFFGGSMEVLLPAGLDIYLLGAKAHDSEIRLARFMIRHLEEGMAMLDVGAHFGFFSRLGAELAGPQGRVLAVEAAGGAFAVLLRNLAGHSSIKAIRAAASDEEGLATFYEFPALFSEYNTLDKAQFETEAWRRRIQPKVVKVPARRMDGLMEEEGLRAQFIKVDVEGAEAQVIAGLPKWLAGSGPRWVAMEYLAEERHNESHRRAAQLLAEYRWGPYIIQGDGSLAPCSDIEAHLKAKGLDSDNVVFQPEGQG